MDSLAQIDREVSVCTDCPLSLNRSRAVPGEGPESADIMLIGEAPGFNEDKQGRPFVGAAGHFLEELLALAKLHRKDVFITNTVKCRPLNNRDPLPIEMETCRKYLDRQIEVIAPKVLVTLGRHSLTAFLPKETIGKARGRPRNLNGTILYPMYHPAAALHQPGLRTIIEEDIKKLPALLKEITSAQKEASPTLLKEIPYVQQEAPPAQKKEREGEQLSMF